MTDKVLYGKYVLAESNGRQELRRDTYVYIDGTEIEAVTRDRPANDQDVTVFENGLIMPGFVNVHSHCIKGALFRGIPDDLPFDPWMPQLIYNILLPLGDIATEVLTPRELESVMAHGMIDILKGGSTTIVDMWNHGQEVFFDNARVLGVRVVGVPYLMSTSELGLDSAGNTVYKFSDDPFGSLRRTIETFRKYDEGRDGLAQVALGPHGADTCLPDLLRETRKAADELGCIITGHLAQTPQEVAVIAERHGMRPVDYYEHCGILGPDALLAHCVFLEDSELEKLARSSSSVANCAISFARDGTNIPFARFHNAGIRTAVGTDSHGMNFVSELRTTGFLSKHHFRSAGVGTAYELVHGGTIAGADALQRPDLGRLAPGCKADILAFDLFKPHLQPVWDPVKNLIWKGSSADLDMVMVHGRVVVDKGRVTTVDEDRIMREAAAAAEKIWALAEERGVLPTRPH